MKYAQWIITFPNGFHISETVVTSWIIMAVLIIASYFLTRKEIWVKMYLRKCLICSII